MGTLRQDIRYALRMMSRSPGYAIVTTLTLAFGIGATTAMFSLVNGVLLRPLVYPESDRLVYIHEFIPSMRLPVVPVSLRHFMEWRQRCSLFENLSLLDPNPMTLTGKGEPERLRAVRVSANLLETLKVQPSLGRTFAGEEETEGQHRVVVLSDALWRRKFKGDRSVIGTAVTLDDETYIVIGVLPARFRLPDPRPLRIPDRPDILTPRVFTASERLMDNFNFRVIARLKEGVPRKTAEAQLNVIEAQLVKIAGAHFELRAVVEPLREAVVKDCRRGLLLVLSAIGSVFLIACLNLAILHLVRAEGRGGESAVRLALGANRLHLLRQALTETMLLTALGAGLGVMAAWAGLGMLLRITPSDIPRLDLVRIDGNVLHFALGLAGMTTLLSGLLPAWRTVRSEVGQVLRAGARTATASAGGFRLRNALVSIEVGLGVVLLLTAGLLLSSFVRVMRADKGFDAPSVLAVDLAPSQVKYDTPERIRDFHGRLLARMASAPGVQSVTIVNVLPLQGQAWLSSVWVHGDLRAPVERPMANVRFVGPDYFQTMGIPLLAGRSFDDSDRSRKVAVISERLAGMLWPEQEHTVGRRFMHEGEYEVVGVMRDVLASADQEAAPILYRPYWDGAPARTTVVARAAGDPFSIATSVREAIRDIDGELPISRMYTMSEVLKSSVSQRRFQVLLTSAFAASALLLAGLGIYGVVSYAVFQRTKEMGIRMAFGAQPRDIYYSVMRRGMTPVFLGLLAAIAGTCAVGHLLRSLLYDISPSDPLTIAVVVMLMSVVALTACTIPARRAAKIDPMEALRYE